ncbi:MAG: histone deacetylase [Planctomycetales bacterium]|nr:histone deacetylase [Planctomycetales bacterium]
MTLLYSSPVFLEHDTGAHPERALRLATISRHLEAEGLLAKCSQPHWKPATRQQIGRLHQETWFDELQAYAQAGGGRIEADTVVSERSFDAAILAAGAVCDAVGRLVKGEDQTALCLVRPPGHHAVPKGAMGFCLLNNIAIGAKEAIVAHDLDRVLIVDWDVHHGNGTQDMFWTDEQVGFFSIHRWPFYPGTGNSDETGSGKGLGYTRNLPIEYGISREDYLAVFTKELEDFAARVKPQLVLVSAGFDAHRQDPIGSLQLETEDFAELTEIVNQIASLHCGGKLVSVLEGGYHPDRLAESVGLHLKGLLDVEAHQT